jgi:signal transduction histidine kinase
VRSWATTGLNRRLAGVFAVAAVVGVVATVLIGATFVRLLDARERLVDDIDSAGFVARDWFASMVNQETGLRGYALTGEDDFLLPYQDGQLASDTLVAQLADLLSADPDHLALTERLAAAADRWRATAADPLIDQVARDGPGSVTEGQLLAGKAVFDEVRVRYGEEIASLDVARAGARQQLDDSTRALMVASVLAGAVLVAGAVAIQLALRRWVLAPIDELRGHAREVASGHLGQPIVVDGPPDLRSLADDVEAMRERILADLEAVEASRIALEHQAADLQRSNRDLEQFAYVASHDLQEPLRKVTGFCQLLQRRYHGQLDEGADQYIDFAVDGAKRMQRLIDDLLVFSRVGRTGDRIEPVPMGEVVAEARRRLDTALDDAGATLVAGPLPTVVGDRAQLTSLVQNLVGNAVKFRGEAPPVIELTAAHTDEGWQFRCHDNGIGIEPQYAERVFVIFQRLHGRDQYEGTGIGLALCRKIVEFHGGRIWVEPAAPEGGTTIRWTIPDRAPGAVDAAAGRAELGSGAAGPVGSAP